MKPIHIVFSCSLAFSAVVLAQDATQSQRHQKFGSQVLARATSLEASSLVPLKTIVDWKWARTYTTVDSVHEGTGFLGLGVLKSTHRIRNVLVTLEDAVGLTHEDLPIHLGNAGWIALPLDFKKFEALARAGIKNPSLEQVIVTKEHELIEVGHEFIAAVSVATCPNGERQYPATRTRREIDLRESFNQGKKIERDVDVECTVTKRVDFEDLHVLNYAVPIEGLTGNLNDAKGRPNRVMLLTGHMTYTDSATSRSEDDFFETSQSRTWKIHGLETLDWDAISRAEKSRSIAPATTTPRSQH